MRRTLTLALAGTALLAAAPAAHGATYPVTGGKLDWTIANQFSSFGDPTRTFLGYITSSGFPGAAAGSVTPSAGATATGPTGAAVSSVGTTAARGLTELYTFSYPVAASGAYSDTGVGTIETTGTITWVAHNLPITFVDPVITLDGLRGVVRASGVTANQQGQTASFDRSKTQFNLDLSKATVTLRADGSRTISGIVPTNTADTALAGFAPNSARYGTMSLTLGLDYEDTQIGAAGREGAAGPAGPAGPAGKNGANGRDAELRVIRLSRAPFATAREVRVRLIDRTTAKTVARGTVERRTLRLGVLTGTTLKGGTYLLKRTAKKASGKRQATVTIK